MASFARCGYYPYRGVSMEYALHDLPPVECLLSTACFSTQYGRPFPLACFKHAALTDMNGSLADINVESAACGARSKTTVVRKLQWGKLFLAVVLP